MCLISVIVPAYNAEKFIENTINSVLNQSIVDWELIVIDDHSTDNTKTIVKSYIEIDSRIKYFKLRKERGVIAARNYGIRVACGRFIAFLDADDLWLPNKLSVQIEFMLRNCVAISCCSYEKIDENGHKMNKIIKAPKLIDYKRVLYDCPVGNLTVVIDRERVPKIVVPNVEKREDFALWLSLLKKEKFIYGIDKVLALYRVHKQSASSRKVKLIKYQWNVYFNIEKIGFLKSMMYTFHYCLIKVLGIK